MEPQPLGAFAGKALNVGAFRVLKGQGPGAPVAAVNLAQGLVGDEFLQRRAALAAPCLERGTALEGGEGVLEGGALGADRTGVIDQRAGLGQRRAGVDMQGVQAAAVRGGVGAETVGIGGKPRVYRIDAQKRGAVPRQAFGQRAQLRIGAHARLRALPQGEQRHGQAPATRRRGQAGWGGQQMHQPAVVTDPVIADRQGRQWPLAADVLARFGGQDPGAGAPILGLACRDRQAGGLPQVIRQRGQRGQNRAAAVFGGLLHPAGAVAIDPGETRTAAGVVEIAHQLFSRTRAETECAGTDSLP